jgi:hypothetical protein
VDGPEIVGEISVGEVLIRHCKITLHPPIFSPRVTDDKSFLCIVVADGKRICRATAEFPVNEKEARNDAMTDCLHNQLDSHFFIEVLK